MLFNLITGWLFGPARLVLRLIRLAIIILFFAILYAFVTGSFE